MGVSPEQQIEKEKKLIAACKNFDRNSQKELFKLYYGYALNISRLFTYAKEDAEEIVNDCFLKLFSSIASIDDSKPLKALIRKIIINRAIDTYRKNKKHYYHLDIEELNEAAVSEDIIGKLRLQEILELLNKLPEHHRLVFNLYEIENYSHEEIAGELNISINSSRVFLLRAKSKLKMLLSKYNHD
jgi:RNA polymerase sigma-70 factor (ECF subfamily)